MSLYEMHYVTSASEEARLKEQQKTMLKSLQELAITAKLRQQQEHERVLARQHHLKSQQHNPKSKNSISSFDSLYSNSSTRYIEVAAECRPYSPYTQPSNSTPTSSYISYERSRQHMATSTSSSTTSSIMDRQRTPSMSSASSSFVSENSDSLHEPDEDKENCYISALETTERDKYGFKRPTQWVKVKQLNDFEAKYKTILQKQCKTWSKLFENNNQQWPPLCPELTRYVRKGIPQDIRTKAWMHYSGADNIMKENPGVYQYLIEKAEKLGKKNEYALVIERDLHRTFPDNSFFAYDSQEKDGSIKLSPESNPKLQMLRRVLLAFSLYSPEIGYCQSLNFVAGFLLLFEKEEEAFWMLVTTIHDYFPKSMFDTTMEGANIEQTVLMMMMYEKMPGVWTKIANKKCFWECERADSLPPVTLVTSHWFLTLYINILPVETVLRIWDCFFVGEGLRILYQVALTIMKLNEQAIWNVNDSVDTFQILQNMPKRLIDCHEFMKSVFSPDGVAFDLTLQEINRKRDLFKSRKSQRKNK